MAGVGAYVGYNINTWEKEMTDDLNLLRRERGLEEFNRASPFDEMTPEVEKKI
jgi:hypothetical protein